MRRLRVSSPLSPPTPTAWPLFYKVRPLHTTLAARQAPSFKPFLPHKELERRAKEKNQLKLETNNSSNSLSSQNAQFDAYWKWLHECKVEHSPMAIMTDPTTGLRGLYVTEDVPAGQVVVSIPFRSCLCSSTFSATDATNHLNVPPPHFLLQAFNKSKTATSKRRRRSQHIETTPLEVQHMWLACVIASIKHRTKNETVAGSGGNSTSTLPFKPLVDMFPTNTSDFSEGVKKAWPKLNQEERKDFIQMADQHERMVYRLHKIWMNWLKKTGRDVVDKKVSATQKSDIDEEEDTDVEESEESDADDLTNAQKPTTRQDSLKRQSEAEQVSATLIELRWAFRVVLLRATLLPSLCEPSVPEDVNTFLAKHEENQHQNQAPIVTSIPCIIPLYDLINHTVVAKNSEEERSPLSPIRYSANCEILTARRLARAEDVEEIADGLLAHIAVREKNKDRPSWLERLKQRQADRNQTEQRATDTGHTSQDSTQNPNLSTTQLPQHLASHPAELEQDVLDRGVVVLMAVEPIVKNTPVLMEYDLSDKAASLLRYGFVE